MLRSSRTHGNLPNIAATSACDDHPMTSQTFSLLRERFKANPIVMSPAPPNDNPPGKGKDTTPQPEPDPEESDAEELPDEPDPADIEAERLVSEALAVGRSPDPPEVVYRRRDGLDISRLYSNEVLFGHDPTPGIVAVDFTDPNIITEYLRDENGATVSRSVRFLPFLWDEMIDNPTLLQARRFPSWVAMCRNYTRGRNQRVLWEPAQQYLTVTGRTLFKGMAFEDLRRMQVDIETDCSEGYEMSNPERDRILAVAVSDSTGWEKLIMNDDEAVILRELSAVIITHDPDIIEGHNFFNFDLPFIMARALKLKVPLLWGRDGTHLYHRLDHHGRPRTQTFRAGGDKRDVRDYRIHGRHIVDTQLLAMDYDVAARRLENYKLKSVAAALGVQEPGRVILQGSDIQKAYREDREAFATYALQDVRETRAISAMLSQSVVVQAQMFPIPYHDVLFVGTASRANTLLLREYLRAGEPIPAAPRSRGYRGALCEIHQRGVINDVWHCDVSSLYPSTMLRFNCLPASDTLGVLRAALTDLRAYRLDAKRLAETARDEQTRTALGALQGAFKILINSAYGYLGTPSMNFADFHAAELVTAVGRNIISRMRDWLTTHGCQVIELDTDGIYFHKPAKLRVEELSRDLNTSLPQGIEVAFDRFYEAMFSYKKKNAAFLLADGAIHLKGGSLRSRAREPFLARYMTTVVRLLLTGRADEIPALFEATLSAVRNRELPLEDFLTRQTLKESLGEYRERVDSGQRNPAAAYEAVIANGMITTRGDRIAFYVAPPPDGEKKNCPAYKRAKLVMTSTNGDCDVLDVEAYVKKLERVAKMFDVFAPRRSTLRQLK